MYIQTFIVIVKYCYGFGMVISIIITVLMIVNIIIWYGWWFQPLRTTISQLGLLILMYGK